VRHRPRPALPPLKLKQNRRPSPTLSTQHCSSTCLILLLPLYKVHCPPQQIPLSRKPVSLASRANQWRSRRGFGFAPSRKAAGKLSLKIQRPPTLAFHKPEAAPQRPLPAPGNQGRSLRISNTHCPASAEQIGRRNQPGPIRCRNFGITLSSSGRSGPQLCVARRYPQRDPLVTKPPVRVAARGPFWWQSCSWESLRLVISAGPRCSPDSHNRRRIRSLRWKHRRRPPQLLLASAPETQPAAA
jgi:hypothetical protein